jgi:hypothetical protein
MQQQLQDFSVASPDQSGPYARNVNYVTARLDGLGARLLS